MPPSAICAMAGEFSDAKDLGEISIGSNAGGAGKSTFFTSS